MTRYLMVDGSYGIYVPKRFYDNVEFSVWGLNKDDFRELNDPDNQHYWDAWDLLLDQAKMVSDRGIEYRLEMDDGDCFVRKIGPVIED